MQLHRGTLFIGVSKNNHGLFQIMFKHNNQMIYLGSYELTLAAMLSDITRIQLTGRHAKTNYDYNREQVLSILRMPNLAPLLRKNLKPGKRV